MTEKKKYSGIYPQLAVTNEGDTESGIGALAVWNNKLWFITYPAHAPQGSDDKLYCLDEELNVQVYQGSVGGTHANRLIHRDSKQLNIGLYFIDEHDNVRVISPDILKGRCTSSARHLEDPENKIYIFTMEEGLYEVDVNTLQVKELLEDKNPPKPHLLPGDHGKGAYSGQGRLVYSNNGKGGVLAQWDGKADPGKLESWQIIDRNKYTEITGPGGIFGSPDDKAPLWALGWDEKSVLLQVCHEGNWFAYRLPKASYTYDADHGWYTEWPRIRNIGREKLLMDMHGMFYEFPTSFTPDNAAGIRPVARHQKMVVDFTDWNGQLVLAANDASLMGNPHLGRPQSNLWFGKFEDLLKMGEPAGWGGLWKDEDIKAGVPSEPFLCSGFDRRVLHLSKKSGTNVSFKLEVDKKGTGCWEEFAVINVQDYTYFLIPENLDAQWLRLTAEKDAEGVSAYFHYGSSSPAALDEKAFRSLPHIGTEEEYSRGVIYPKNDNALTLGFAAEFIDSAGEASGTGYYEIGAEMVLRKTEDPAAEEEIRTKLEITKDYEVDAASVIMYDEAGNRYRLPKGSALFDGISGCRCKREVVTERFLMNVHGTFYELPRESAGDIAKIKPICTHNRLISDFASWRGMLVLAGNLTGAAEDEHFVPSDDGKAGLWFGNVDDLWIMGSPKGEGGPCLNTPMEAGRPSDPYLMTGYAHKSVSFSHDSSTEVTFTIEVDFLAEGSWHVYDKVTVKPGEKIVHTFPAGFNAHWVRVTVDRDCKATAWFVYVKD